MKNTILNIFLFIIVAMGAKAQTIDTLNQGTKNKFFTTDSAEFSAYDFAKTSPFYIKKLMPENFSSISIGHIFEKGKLIKAQDATTLNNTYISTEGISQLKSVSLWGKFTYQKAVEDSTAFAHQTRSNLANPYYFGSARNANYHRSVYNLKALASRNFIGNNLPIGLGADYKVGDHYATNDPRGEIKEFQLNLVGTIGYNLTKAFALGAGYRYGRGQESTSVTYKNTSLGQGGKVIPEYINYLIIGYGEPEEYNDRTFVNHQTRNGMDAYATYDSENLGSLNFSFQTSKETQEVEYRTPNSINHYASFNLVNESYRLFWLKKNGSSTWTADLSYVTNDGDNFVDTLKANSYLFKTNSLSGKAGYNWINKQFSHHVVVGLKKYEERKIDGIAGNDIRFNQLNYSLSYGFNHQNKNNHNWGISLTGLYNQYLDSDFNVLIANEGVFTRNVIYHDYAFNTTSKYGGNLTFDYSLPMFKQIQAGIKVAASYWRRDDIKEFGRILTKVPGKDRFASNISLNLYF